MHPLPECNSVVNSCGSFSSSTVFWHIVSQFVGKNVQIVGGHTYKGKLGRISYKGKTIYFVSTSESSYHLAPFSYEEIASINFDGTTFTIHLK